MPLYEFACPECAVIREVLQLFDAAKPTCCGDVEMTRVVSAPAIRMHRTSAHVPAEDRTLLIDNEPKKSDRPTQVSVS